MSYIDMEKMVGILMKDWFRNDKFLLEDEDEGDSCNFHAMTHQETEILGIFCDVTGIYGAALEEVLVRGYLSRMTKLKENK